MADFWPIVNRCERRLIHTSAFLNEAGRLELVNAVFSALPTYAMSTFLLPKTVIKQVDKYRKHCLWRGADPNSKKPSKAAWHMVCVPKEKGGLGILNLQTQNESLLMENLHKFFNKLDIPWVHLLLNSFYANGNLSMANSRRYSFWWRDNLKLLDHFKGLAQASVVSGSSCFFWTDVWDDNIRSIQYPQLFSYAKDKNLSVQQFLQPQDLLDNFFLPLSEEAFDQLLDMFQLLSNTNLQEGADRWTYI